MAKMRVHELAKELNIESKDVITALSGSEFEVKSAQSGIEDAAQEIVRKKFAKAAPAKNDVAKSDAPKADEAKSEEHKKNIFRTPAPSGDRPKKKSSITAVYNAQYSKDRKPGQRNNGQKDEYP